MRRGGRQRRSRHGMRGMSLIEVMIAAFLLIIVFFGLAQFYYRGRRQLDYEEDRRKATAVAQLRFDALRRDFRYDDLPGLEGTDTHIVSDNRDYTVHHTISAGVPETNATTVTLDVRWVAKAGSGDVTRTMSAVTILGRGMP